MSENRVVIFTSSKEENAQTLAGILKSYKIQAEIKENNGSFNLLVDAKNKDGASAIIKKHVKKPGSKDDLLSEGTHFIKEYKVTAFLLIVCAAFFCITSFGQDLNQVKKLFFSDVFYQRSINNNEVIQTPVFKKGYEELQGGQIWRAITPSFIHSNLIHFLINLLLIFHMGKIVEKISGFSYLLSLVLISAIVGNFTQFFISGNPHFGGMNSVVLSLLGFNWVRSMFDTSYFERINPGIIFFGVAWIAASFLNLFHLNNKYGAVAGLTIGVVWGFLSSKLLPKERLIPRKESIY